MDASLILAWEKDICLARWRWYKKESCQIFKSFQERVQLCIVTDQHLHCTAPTFISPVPQTQSPLLVLSQSWMSYALSTKILLEYAQSRRERAANLFIVW